MSHTKTGFLSDNQEFRSDSTIKSIDPCMKLRRLDGYLFTICSECGARIYPGNSGIGAAKDRHKKIECVNGAAKDRHKKIEYVKNEFFRT